MSMITRQSQHLLKYPSNYLPNYRRQAGIGHVIAIAFLVLALAAVGFIGYTLYFAPNKVGRSADYTGNSQTVDQSAASSAERSAAVTPANVPEVTSAQGLDQAATTLDQVDTESEGANDARELNTQLNAF